MNLKLLKAMFPVTVVLLKKAIHCCVFAVAVVLVIAGKLLKKLAEQRHVAGVSRLICGKLRKYLPKKIGDGYHNVVEYCVSKPKPPAPPPEPTLDEKIEAEEQAHLADIDAMGDLRKTLFRRDKRLAELREERAAERASGSGSGSGGAKVSVIKDDDDDKEEEEKDEDSKDEDPNAVIDDGDDVPKASSPFCGFRC